MFIAPTDALRPNKVPCGPDRTSSDWISKRPELRLPGRGMYTPSRKVATEGSTALLPYVPSPRIVQRALTEPGPDPKLNVGTSRVRSEICVTFALASASPPKAEIDIGTY